MKIQVLKVFEQIKCGYMDKDDFLKFRALCDKAALHRMTHMHGRGSDEEKTLVKTLNKEFEKLDEIINTKCKNKEDLVNNSIRILTYQLIRVSDGEIKFDIWLRYMVRIKSIYTKFFIRSYKYSNYTNIKTNKLYIETLANYVLKTKKDKTSIKTLCNILHINETDIDHKYIYLENVIIFVDFYNKTVIIRAI